MDLLLLEGLSLSEKDSVNWQKEVVGPTSGVGGICEDIPVKSGGEDASKDSSSPSQFEEEVYKVTVRVVMVIFSILILVSILYDYFQSK